MLRASAGSLMRWLALRHPELAARLRRKWRLAEHRRSWERQWASDDFDPHWLGRGVSREICEAAENGWFPRGGRALDVGCGEGEVAAWLAERGYPAVGVDVAESAVARARELYGERPGQLRFARVDLCQRAPEGGPFRIIVDRGCFLQIPDEERRGYAARLASVSTRDARLLLYGRAFRDGMPFGDPEEIERLRAEIMNAFGPHFVPERTAPTYLDRFHDRPPEERVPGIVFWLQRREL